MKQTKTSFLRIFSSITIAICIILTTFSPAFAAEKEESSAITPRAGVETWSNSSSTYVGSMHMQNNNLSPVKTIGRSGTLHIWGHFYGEDANAASSPIQLRAEIRQASGSAINGNYCLVRDNRSGLVHFSTSCAVTAGQKVQIYFDASSISNPPGYYRQAYIEYYYYID